MNKKVIELKKYASFVFISLFFLCLILINIANCQPLAEKEKKTLSKKISEEAVLVAKKGDLKSLEAGRKKLLEAIELDKGNENAHSYLGYIYFKQNQYSKAAEEFAIAKKLNSTQAYYYYMLGVIKEMEGDHRSAVDELATAVIIGFGEEEKKLLPDAYFCLGYAYENIGDYANAYENYKKACSLRPDKEKYRFSLAGILFKQKKFAQSKKEYETIKKMASPGSETFQEAANRIKEIDRKKFFSNMAVIFLVSIIVLAAVVFLVVIPVLKILKKKSRKSGKQLPSGIAEEEKPEESPHEVIEKLKEEVVEEVQAFEKIEEIPKEPEILIEEIKIEEIKTKEIVPEILPDENALILKKEDLLSSGNIYRDTGFYKSEILLEILEIEAFFSVKSKEPFCLIVFKMDELNKLIEKLTLENKKIVIREIYDIIRTFIRIDLDIAFSMDLENFAVILHQVDKNTALDIAGRYKKAIDGVSVEGKNLKFSYGFSVFPEDCLNIKELYDLALKKLG